MSGILASIRESFAGFLQNDVASGAKAFFTENAKPIPVFTEKLKSFEQAIADALTSTGLGVIVATVTASDAQSQWPDKIAFKTIKLLARVIEVPDSNDTGVAASDCAEAISQFARKFKFNGSPLEFVSIALGSNPGTLCYDVTFTLEAQADPFTARP